MNKIVKFLVNEKELKGRKGREEREKVIHKIKRKEIEKDD